MAARVLRRLADLLDVAVSSPADGEVLTYNSSTSKWANEAAGAGSSAVLMSSTTLSSAQLLNLHTTAVQLLPAPGGRFYYDVQHIVWHYRYGTTPYSGMFDDLVIGFYPAGVPMPAYDSGAPGFTFFTAPGGNSIGFDTLAQTEDVYLMRAVPVAGVALAWLASAIENKPLSIGLTNLTTTPDPTTPWTGGNGSLTIRTFYSRINGA